MDKIRDSSSLTIQKLPQGGFVVSKPPGMGDLGFPLFASLQIGEALTFIADAMDTEAQKSPGDDDLMRFRKAAPF
jgi:hypothetical protein